MLQELIPEVAERGETSLVFLGGVFSHAVVKRAKPGDFRVQKDFGGHVEVTTPSAALLSFAASGNNEAGPQRSSRPGNHLVRNSVTPLSYGAAQRIGPQRSRKQ